MAATFEKANTYVFAATIIRDREVGGSNPLAPTTTFKHLRLPAKVAVLVLWQDCGRPAVLPLQQPLVSLDPSRECSVAWLIKRKEQRRGVLQSDYVRGFVGKQKGSMPSVFSRDDVYCRT